MLDLEHYNSSLFFKLIALSLLTIFSSYKTTIYVSNNNKQLGSKLTIIIHRTVIDHMIIFLYFSASPANVRLNNNIDIIPECSQIRKTQGLQTCTCAHSDSNLWNYTVS